MVKVESVILDGESVRLEPLKLKHLESLCEAGSDESLWRWTPSVCSTEAAMKKYVKTALEEFDHKVSLPFVTIETVSGRIVGSTRFGNIDVKNRKAEIGWTWIKPNRQRTSINTEAKLLMLTHAFEVWKCIRVELKTDALNEQSRNAILRLGAREEGIFRNHLITDTGRFRNTVYFSIIENEWQTVKENLQNKLRNY